MGFLSSTIVASTFAGYFAFTTIYSNMRRELMKRTNRHEDKMAGILVDSITNCEAVRYFGTHKYESGRYDEHLKQYEESQIEVLHTLAKLNFGQQCIINAGLFSIMGLATFNVLQGTMPVGDVVALNTLVLQLSQPLHFLGGAYRMVLQGVVDVEKLDKFLKKEPKYLPGTDSYQYRGGHIQLKDVNFRVLKGVNMDIPAGSKIGICGPSGSGKSTILKLISSVLSPDSGKISVDNQDLTTLALDTDTYVKHIGVVPQEGILFNDTILFNLKYAKQDSTKEEIELACSMAQVHDRILQFPKGYDTKVGERGTSLSGGERQRIAIARCLLRNPRILLFDEATAALDLETEAKLTGAIDSFITGFGRDKTMVIVAHRLSTIRKCDTIFYMEEGQIKEVGSHDELIERGGSYKRLWDLNDMRYDVNNLSDSEESENGNGVSDSSEVIDKIGTGIDSGKS